MDLSAATFRLVMGNFTTGVSVVTALGPDATPSGITVNALSSVSLDPPLVMVALDRRRFITPIVRDAGRYAVNILGEEQQALSDCFANAPTAADRPDRAAFCGAVWHAGSTGLPILEGAIAWLECSVVERFSAGDHDLFIGRVEAMGRAPGSGSPLLYFRRRYLRIERASSVPVAGRPES